MSHAERIQKIESYGQAYHKLITALPRFPREMWQYRAKPEGWTVHEIIVHIADSEANSYARCRRFIAEPGSTVMAYDEMAWARKLNYHAQSPEAALELFKCLRECSYQLIKTLPETTWASTIVHPENGVMTMDDWLDVYDRHVPDHIAQMQEVYAAWQRHQT
ncbi:MAG TPA: DinB family protein [Anaerolineae bacterium]|nr:DinB family protein [Anaerolineae bacterium]